MGRGAGICSSDSGFRNLGDGLGTRQHRSHLGGSVARCIHVLPVRLGGLRGLPDYVRVQRVRNGRDDPSGTRLSGRPTFLRREAAPQIALFGSACL